MSHHARTFTIFISCLLLSALLRFSFGLLDDAIAPQTPWQHWSTHAPAWYQNIRASLSVLVDVSPGLLAGFLLRRSGFAFGAILGLLVSVTPMLLGFVLHGSFWHYDSTIPDVVSTVVLSSVSCAAGELLSTRRALTTQSR